MSVWLKSSTYLVSADTQDHGLRSELHLCGLKSQQTHLVAMQWLLLGENRECIGLKAALTGCRKIGRLQTRDLGT